MPPLNSDLLQQIGTRFGDNSQYPSPLLNGVLQAVVQAPDYIRDYFLLRASSTPSGGAGNVTWLWNVPDTESWELIQGVLINANGMAADVSSIMLKDGLSNQPVQCRVPAGETMGIIGDFEFNYSTGAIAESRPGRVLLPQGSSFTLTLAPVGGNFDALPLGVDILGLRKPKWRTFERVETDIEGVP